MKTDTELERLAEQIYWEIEHGELGKAIDTLRQLELDATRDANSLLERMPSHE